ncbi:MAG TPA: outer membrane beta-barrel protein [Candidatus Sulfotelmatobacter sp.]
MSERRLLVAALAVLTILAASAAAQDEKNELDGSVGRIFVSDQGILNPPVPDAVIRSGKGTSFEIDYARHIWVTPIYAISGEVPVLVNLDEDLNGPQASVPIDYKQYFITPSARVNLFPTTAFSPWVSFGAGFGYFSQNNTLVYGGGTNPGKGGSTSVIQGGFGLDVKFKGRFSMRGEVRDFWSGEPDFPNAPTGKSRQHNYFVGGGVVYKF